LFIDTLPGANVKFHVYDSDPAKDDDMGKYVEQISFYKDLFKIFCLKLALKNTE